MTCPVCPSAQHAIDSLAAENRALSSENRALTAYLSTDWQGLLSETVSFAARNWPQSPGSASNKVVTEALELNLNPTDLTEAADVVITILCWLAANQRTIEELHAAVAAKMLVNRRRVWQRNGEGSFQHVEVTT